MSRVRRPSPPGSPAQYPRRYLRPEPPSTPVPGSTATSSRLSGSHSPEQHQSACPSHHARHCRSAVGPWRGHDLEDPPPPSSTRADHLSGRHDHRPAQPDGVAAPTRRPRPDLGNAKCWRQAPARRMLRRDVRGEEADASCQGRPGGLPHARARPPGVGLHTARAGRRWQRRAWRDPAGTQRQGRHGAGHGRLSRIRTDLRPDSVRLQPRGTRRAGDRACPRHRRRPSPTLGRPPAAAGSRPPTR
jgi:hypothetical protein